MFNIVETEEKIRKALLDSITAEFQKEIDMKIIKSMDFITVTLNVEMESDNFFKIMGIPLPEYWNKYKFSDVKCPKCNHFMLVSPSNFIVSDSFGCPRCGHIEGGTY